MAHSAMHFGLGITLGAASGAPFLRAAFSSETTRNSATWLAISYGLGTFAVLPSFLGTIGIPEAITSAWYMNVFLLYPLINDIKSGGKLIGEVLIVSTFIFQYFMMMLLLYKTTKKSDPTN